MVTYQGPIIICLFLYFSLDLSLSLSHMFLLSVCSAASSIHSPPPALNICARGLLATRSPDQHSCSAQQGKGLIGRPTALRETCIPPLHVPLQCYLPSLSTSKESGGTHTHTRKHASSTTRKPNPPSTLILPSLLHFPARPAQIYPPLCRHRQPAPTLPPAAASAGRNRMLSRLLPGSASAEQ